MSTYSSYQCPYCGQSTRGLTINRPATTSFCPPAQPIRGKVEDPEVVLPPEEHNVSLTDSESSSSLWAVTPMSCSTLSVSSEWESNSSLWAVTPMSCSTLSVSSEWESTDSVERATDNRGKELETDRYQRMYKQYLETGLLSPYYVLPVFRRGRNSRCIETYKDRYQAVPVHMDENDIAEYLASLSAEVECTERKVGKKKVSVKKAEKKIKKKELKEAKKERKAAKKEEKAKLKAVKKAEKKAKKAKKKELKQLKKKTKSKWRRTSKVAPMVIVNEAT